MMTTTAAIAALVPVLASLASLGLGDLAVFVGRVEGISDSRSPVLLVVERKVDDRWCHDKGSKKMALVATADQLNIPFRYAKAYNPC